jgi:putative membrane-bound dehydrogenase-like protein
MRVPAGFRVELFAAEPLVTNPTNLDVDDRGRVWVTESPNYDAPPDQFDPKGDKVIILEDTNGDGRADSRKVFFEHPALNAPMGLLLAPGRVYLSQAPYLLVLNDTNGDDRADRVDTLFSGFGKRDHGLHSAFWGPDGKLYFSMGNYGGQVRDARGVPRRDRAGNLVSGQGTPYRNGLILRCNSDGSDLETLAHNFRNQYEPAIDSYGTIWVTDNDDDGNQACRLVQAMEGGNFGFADERTGAAWTAHRTNLEPTVPERHWHQHDPGVVPNVLVTGAGSPAGLAFYEGTQFPEPYRNQPLHAEALHNVVRFYPTARTGAGYTARITPVLTSSDQWFRPVDVSVAPDGSVLLADWYDPGIGGGTAADSKKGRVYRLSYGAPRPYRFSRPRLTTPEAAAAALRSPNRYLQRAAYEKLNAWGTASEPALRALWQDPNPVVRARALWLLARLPQTGYLSQALAHPDPNLRLAGIRAARQVPGLKLPEVLHPLATDADPMVRREVALTLRFDGTEAAHTLWATLAAQHDGRDRWYLEALGIGADPFPDGRLAAWLQRAGEAWNTPAGHDLLWRARTSAALPYLARIIRAAPTPAATLRYFRAFDFHEASAQKQAVLLSLLDDPRPDVQRLALQHLDGADVPRTPAVRAALDQALRASDGTSDFVQLVQKFHLTEQVPALLALVRQLPTEPSGRDALALLWAWNQRAVLTRALTDEPTARAVLEAFRGDGRPEVLGWVRAALTDERLSPEVRKAAVRTLGSSWAGETLLLDEVRKPGFPDLLKPAAAGVLFGAYRNSIKREAERYLPKPQGKDGEALPPVYLLAYERGTAAAGRTVFGTYCRACHAAEGRGAAFGTGAGYHRGETVEGRAVPGHSVPRRRHQPRLRNDSDRNPRRRYVPRHCRVGDGR